MNVSAHPQTLKPSNPQTRDGVEVLVVVEVVIARVLTFSICSSVKLMSSFLISYPLAGVLKRIPDSKPHLKNIFIVLYGPFPSPFPSPTLSTLAL